MQMVNIRKSSFENCVFLLCLQVTIIYHHLMPLDWMLSSLAEVIPVQIALEHRSDRYTLQLLYFTTSSSAKIQNFHASVQLSQRMRPIGRPSNASQKTGEEIFERCKVSTKTFKRKWRGKNSKNKTKHILHVVLASYLRQQRFFMLLFHMPKTYFSGGEKRKPKLVLVSQATDKSTALSMIYQKIPKLLHLRISSILIQQIRFIKTRCSKKLSKPPLSSFSDCCW